MLIRKLFTNSGGGGGGGGGGGRETKGETSGDIVVQDCALSKGMLLAFMIKMMALDLVGCCNLCVVGR